MFKHKGCVSIHCSYYFIDSQTAHLWLQRAFPSWLQSILYITPMSLIVSPLSGMINYPRLFGTIFCPRSGIIEHEECSFSLSGHCFQVFPVRKAKNTLQFQSTILSISIDNIDSRLQGL